MVQQLSTYLKAALPSLAALGLLWGLFNWWTLGFQAFTSYSYVRNQALPLPQPPPSLTLQDHQGKLFQLDQLKGKYYLLTFGFMDCTGTCPISLSAFSEINTHLQKIGAGDLVLLTVTLIPRRDRQDKLDYVWKNFGSPKGWILSSPKIETMEIYWKKLEKMGMWVDLDQWGTPIHDDLSFLINPEGMIISSFESVPSTEKLLEKMQKEQP